ncbi:MAG: ATP-binding protein [Hydrococcus sp. Prado102]|jgi:signal transduction histidine kinase|nr:ATP-binding protein [Hydrococcus sp. Prado102]
MPAAPVPQKTNLNRTEQKRDAPQELDARLQTILDLFDENMGVNYCLLLRLDGNKNQKTYHLSKTSKNEENLVNFSYKLAENYQVVLRKGNPLAFSEADLLFPLTFKKTTQNNGIRSLLLVPIVEQQLYLGEIFLYSCECDRQWSEQELKFIKILAQRCSLEIAKTELKIAIEKQKLQQKLILKINQILNSDRPFKKILENILIAVGQGFELERAIIFNLKESTSQIEKEWRINKQISCLSCLNISIWKPSEILIFKQQARVSQFNYKTNELIATLFNIPLFVRGEFFGSLSLQPKLLNYKFAPEEINTLELVAQQIAIALYNIQTQTTIEQLEECAKNLEIEKQQSEAANCAKSEFLSHMNHELRTPLTGILGFARMLKDEIYGPLNPKQQQYACAIASSGEHLLSLVNDFLDISKIEANREELFLETIAVKDLCVSSLSMLESRSSEQGLDLLLEITPDIDFCTVDRRRIQQILINLLSNAIKFTEVGSVTLKVQRNGDMLDFCVIDTGIGIKKADQDKLFQPFQQINSSLSRKHKGTGLGLTLSRKLAQLHGGDITLISKEGQGSCFTLSLPI